MKIGDKVVCVDDSPGKSSGVKKLTINEIYTVLDIFMAPQGLNIVVHSGDLGWLASRFRPIVDIGDEVEEYILSKINQPVEV